jgi:hypothetical protein
LSKTIRFPPERCASVEFIVPPSSGFPTVLETFQTYQSFAAAVNPCCCSADASSATLFSHWGALFLPGVSSILRLTDGSTDRLGKSSSTQGRQGFRNFQKNLIEVAAESPPLTLPGVCPGIYVLNRTKSSGLLRTSKSLTTTAYVAATTSDSFDVTHHLRFCQRFTELFSLFSRFLLWKRWKLRA